MKILGSFLVLVTLVLLLLPALAAQEKKDDKKEAVKGDKTEKKDAPAEGAEPEKKEVKKKVVEEKVVYGQVLPAGKLLKLENGDLQVEVPLPDPQKLSALEIWSANQMNAISQEQNPVNFQNRMMNYQYELQQKQVTETTTNQNLDFHASEKLKVRLAFPPFRIDEQGNPKKWKAKELAALRSRSLPGYAADVDALRPGQTVLVYLAKLPTPPRLPPGQRKKKFDFDSEPGLPTKRECVMIVVLEDVVR